MFPWLEGTAVHILLVVDQDPEKAGVQTGLPIWCPRLTVVGAGELERISSMLLVAIVFPVAILDI